MARGLFARHGWGLEGLTRPQQAALVKALLNLEPELCCAACNALHQGGSVAFYFDPARVALDNAELHADWLTSTGKDKFLSAEDRAACEHWQQSAHAKQMHAVTHIEIKRPSLPEPLTVNITQPETPPKITIVNTFEPAR